MVRSSFWIDCSHGTLPQWFLLPLRSVDEEPVLDLEAILAQVYQEAALDLAIDYSIQPIPPVLEADFEWFQTLSQV